MKLTERKIARLRPDTARTNYADAGCPGLSLRVTSDGRRIFTLRVRDAAGKQVRLTLGDHHPNGFNLAAARGRAAELRAYAKAGLPLRPERPQATGGYTVAELIEAFRGAVLDRQRRGHDAYLGLVGALRGMADEPANAIATGALARLIDRRAQEAPAAARNLTSFLRGLFRWARERGHVPIDPAEPLKAPGRPARRDRVLSDAELGAIWRAAGLEPGVAGPFVRALILTCARLNELAGMRRPEIDRTTGLWTLPAERTKTDRALVSPLGAAAVAEIERALAMAPSNSALVFTINGDAPLSGWSKIKARLDRVSGCTGWTFHDFRRTGVSRMADAGIDPAVADRVLNHQAAGTLSTVARVYQQSDLLEPRRVALGVWERHVIHCAGEGAALASGEAAKS